MARSAADNRPHNQNNQYSTAQPHHNPGNNHQNNRPKPPKRAHMLPHQKPDEGDAGDATVPTGPFGESNPYINTDEGAIYSNNNPEAYYNLAIDNAGLHQGGVTPFDQWARREGYGIIKGGFDDATQIDKNINFRDWLNGSGGNYLSTLSGGALSQGPPVNTGNPFTSSSGGGGINAMGSITTPTPVPGKGNGSTPNPGKLPTLPGLPGATNPAIGGGDSLAALKRIYRNYTPEQRGQYSSGYSYGPARWSVFG